MQDANKQTKYDLDIIDYKNNLIACINRAESDIQKQQQALQTISKQQQIITQIGNNEIKQDVISSKALSVGQAHRMQRHINKLDLEIDKLEQKLQALETHRLQVDKPLAFAEKDKQVMLKSIAYDKGVFSAKQAELKQQRQQKLNQQQEFSQTEQSVAFEQTKTSRHQTMQQKQQELHRLEQEEQTLQQNSQESNVTAILTFDLRKELNSKINNLHREIKQLAGQTYTELINGIDNSLLEEKLVNTNLRTQVKLIDSDKTAEEKQKIIARNETCNELSFNLEHAHARTEHITTPLITGALAFGVYSNPITTLGALGMYSIVDPYVTDGIQSGISAGLERYSVDVEVANTVAALLASAISFIVPLPFIDRFAGKLSANIKEYNIVSSKLKLNNFLSAETKDFIAKASNGNAYSKKSEHSTLFFSKKMQIDDFVIQAYKDRAIDLTAYRNGYMRNVLEHVEHDKSITYNTLIYDANDTHVTKAIEHTVLRQEAIDAAIAEQAVEHALSELQSKNLLGIEVSKGNVASKIAAIEQAKVVTFSHEMKMTGTDGKHIVVNKVVDDVVNIDKVSAEGSTSVSGTEVSTISMVGKDSSKFDGNSNHLEDANFKHEQSYFVNSSEQIVEYAWEYEKVLDSIPTQQKIQYPWEHEHIMDLTIARQRIEYSLQDKNILDANGKLTYEAKHKADRMIDGEKIGDPIVISELTKNGSSIKPWGKYVAKAKVELILDMSIKQPLKDGPTYIETNTKNIELHFYMNQDTHEVCYTNGFKIKAKISLLPDGTAAILLKDGKIRTNNNEFENTKTNKLNHKDVRLTLR